MTALARARRTLMMVEIPRDELALRIAIKCTGMRQFAACLLQTAELIENQPGKRK